MTCKNTVGSRTLFVAGLAGLCALSAGARADTAKEQELEKRVTQLEKMLNELTSKPAAPAPTATPAPAAPAVQTKSITPNALAGTRFVYTGYAKLDALWSKYDDGAIAAGAIGRDFYLPSAIPVGAPAQSQSASLNAHVKQSRFIFGTDTDLADKGSLQSRLEVDLYGVSLGDTRATNTYGVLLRQAYIQYNSWLFGQTWSNFQDVGALPETADYIGPTDGTVFVRQPMVKYSNGSFSLSAENPETTITPFGGGTRIVGGNGVMPDLTGAYTFKFSNGYIRGAVLARQLKYQTTGTVSANDSAMAGAVSLAGKINFGDDDLRFMAIAGNALGRYVGVNFANDAVLDAQGRLDTIGGWAGFAAWRHLWTKQLRSTLMVSASSYNNDLALTGAAANKSSRAAAVNLFYTPTPKLDLGVELRRAEIEREGGADGSMTRLQGTAKYSF